jgi:CBS domain-containing protein
MSVSKILKQKGSSKVTTIYQDETVLEAIQKLCANRIGVLLVLDRDQKVVGILSERDCMSAASKDHQRLGEIKIAEAMTREVIICEPDDDLEKVRNIVTANRIRHLPVAENGKVVGLISIGDIVKAELREVNVENRYLRDFISGQYPG